MERDVFGRFEPRRGSSIPAPYRGVNPIERPTDPASLRAADRYRRSLDTGDWDRLRERLSNPTGLRTTTTRNLERLRDRYSRGFESVPVTGSRSDDSGRSSRDYRFAYDRGPLDRLARPNAPEPETRRRPAPTVVDRVARDLSRGRTPSLLDSNDGIARRAPDALERGGRLGLETRGRDTPERRALDGLSRVARNDPDAARRIARTGARLADVTRTGVGIVTRGLLGSGAGSLVDAHVGAVPPGYEDHPGYYWNDCYWNSGFGTSWCWGPWGYGPWGCNPWGWGLGFGINYCNPFWYGYPGAWGYYCNGFPYGYSWCAPLYYSNACFYGGFADPLFIGGGTTVIVQEQPVIVIDESAPVENGGGAGGATFVAGPQETQVSGAAETYLTLGDRAFREGRYADAVHFYTKATELEPEVGVFSLVLFDALFATGDYGFAAFALRRALSIEPQLIEFDVDKRTFYSDPADFDRQLGTLEQYVADHPADQDARLVLAANQLFSAAPGDAVATLEDPLAVGVLEEQSAILILARAQELELLGPR
ncbi:MAG: tetratricopeptide repeat protein [Planctomycetota bacterium]